MLRGQLRPVIRLVGIGWYVSLCIVVGVVAGLLLDGRFDSRPIFTLIGLGLGIFLSFWGLFKMLGLVLNQSRDNRNGNA